MLVGLRVEDWLSKLLLTRKAKCAPSTGKSGVNGDSSRQMRSTGTWLFRACSVGQQLGKSVEALESA